MLLIQKKKQPQKKTKKAQQKPIYLSRKQLKIKDQKVMAPGQKVKKQ